ncbi:MAG TPA: DNA replication/repair protein RecF [Rhodanobacteraceae bacterium]|nr:DNA replication/repair protein RecF [Rhodanobacteraceae bacterium]
MRIDLLRAHHLRCFSAVEVAPGPGFNWLVGPNGAGKTTLLEAVYLLSHGHSFRAGARDALVQRGRAGFDLFAELSRTKSRHRIGLARGEGEWRVQIDGEPRATLSPLLELCAVVCFEPGSHALIAGAAEQRRRFLDWGVFHVEHQSLDWWREYRRTLRQRNALLKQDNNEAGQFEFWEAELGRLGERIDQARRAYFEVLQQHISGLSSTLVPELGEPRLGFRSGWDRERTLQELLAEHRAQDRIRGHTRVGPHHADWRLEFEHAPGREFLSRGQTKLAALACVMAQAAVFAAHWGEWPLLCLDDLTSELDEAHQRIVLEWVAERPAQVWLTATQLLETRVGEATRFHVEHGNLRRI